ncbi:hypothetical protein BKA80DRAFT_310933 [Phyllosticta citrichinensis]
MSNAAALDELRNEMKLRAEQINLSQRSAAAQPPSSDASFPNFKPYPAALNNPVFPLAAAVFISLKTLALQTLRQEYDALLAKLDRQRTKCSTLEKKFAVSDVELNALTVDKEELEAKTQALEQQVKELREARDEARRGEVRTSEQYRTIVEMASRLQKGAAEERRPWAAEREALVRAARGEQSSWPGEQGAEKKHAVGFLAETVVHSPPFDDEPGPARTTSAPDISSDLENASNQVIEALRVEVAQLRSRNQSLEAVLQKLQVEMEPLRSAVCTITEAQTRMEEAAREALRVA